MLWIIFIYHFNSPIISETDISIYILQSLGLHQQRDKGKRGNMHWNNKVPVWRLELQNIRRYLGLSCIQWSCLPCWNAVIGWNIWKFQSTGLCHMYLRFGFENFIVWEKRRSKLCLFSPSYWFCDVLRYPSHKHRYGLKTTFLVTLGITLDVLYQSLYQIMFSLMQFDVIYHLQ